MSHNVYQTPKSKFWQADIWIDGRKFSRSTGKVARGEGKVGKGEAMLAAAGLEIELRNKLAEGEKAEVSLTLDHVAGRYMRDIGNHHKGARNTAALIAFLIKFFGPDKLMTEMTNQDVFNLVNWRRAHHVGEWHRDKDGNWVHREPDENSKLISSYTVNDTTEQLKKLFTYLKRQKVKLPDTIPDFSTKEFWLREPKARPRSFSNNERAGLNKAIDKREDIEPILLFSRMSGKRKMEAVTLEWDHVDWDRDVIERYGKGGALVTIKITPAIRAILWPLRGHHPKYVFTYVAQRTKKVKRKDGKVEQLVKGKRYPYTDSGLRRTWTTLRQRAGIPIEGPNRARWHDIRHDFAISFLKDNPTAYGMKSLQTALDHSDFQTTAGSYGHVLETEVEQQVEAHAQKLLQERLVHKAKKA
jgi:integrase